MENIKKILVPIDFSDYSKKALKLAQRINDAWLISQTHTIIWSVASSFNINPNFFNKRFIKVL